MVTAGLRDGIPPKQHLATIPRMRGALQSVNQDLTNLGRALRDEMLPKSDTVLARALRARNPGPVLARAAEEGECDSLTDPYVRLWMGLKPLE